jgi:5,10-methylenetetrahydromethanopterin reductase
VPALGFVIRPEHPPEELPGLARRVEAAGFDELWLWEDCFLAGGIAATSAALAATDRIHVGLGIMPAPVRNPAFAAMEIAALERLHPGRIAVGIGHGVTAWMRQIGAKPESQLALLEETVGAVRALLAGEELHADGRYVRLDRVKLDHPPAAPPPIYTGVRRPKSLAVSGRVADGTILSEPSSPAYVEWARGRISSVRPHRITVYAWCALGPDARATLLPLLEERMAQGGPQFDDADELTDERVAQMTVSGTPDEAKASIRALGEAGADAVVLIPPEPGADPAAFAQALM